MVANGGPYLRGPPSDAVVDLMASAEWSSCFLVAGDEERTVLMFRLIWIASIHTRDFLHRYMPSNIVLDRLRTRRGLKWGVPAMLLAIPYLVPAASPPGPPRPNQPNPSPPLDYTRS